MNTHDHRVTSLDEHGGSVTTWIAFGVVSIALFGLAYPLATALLGGALFPDQARGSLIERDGRIVGSRLVAQPFVDPRYFIPRPSAAGYAGMGLAGSNWAPSNPALRERMQADSALIAEREGIEANAIPSELITASGSGIDPHLTPAAAALQVPRIASARGIEPSLIQSLLEAQTLGPDLGVLGQARLNVLELNLALDALASPPVAAP